MPDLSAKICLLLAVHEGARFLPEQLNSYRRQSRKDWCLLASIDGDQDCGSEIIREFGRRHAPGRVQLIPGTRTGAFADNFLHLLTQAPLHETGPDWFALSDQDDVWYHQKLARAVSRLETLPPDIPAVYCGRTVYCADDLSVLRASPRFEKAPEFPNALVQSIGGGNTMVLNRAALHLVRAAAAEVTEIVSHDWWITQILTATGGTVIYDLEPTLHYRQHAHNLVGENRSPRAQLTRLAQLLDGRFRHAMDVNLQALQRSSHRFTPEAQQVISRFMLARRCRTPLGRVWRLYHAGVWRQGKTGTAALYLAALIGRL
jgi:hypothetical protein